MLVELAEGESVRRAEFSDRALLQNFVCTDPSRKHRERGYVRTHPTPWELDVQSNLRNLRPPFRDDSEGLTVLVRGGKLVSAAHFGYSTDGEAVIVFSLAVSIDERGQGYGGYLLRTVLGELERQDPDAPVFARIDDRNDSSQALFGGLGFERTEERDAQEVALRLWTYTHPFTVQPA